MSCGLLDFTLTFFRAQNSPLLADRVDEFGLLRSAPCEPGVQLRMMLIAALRHFRYERVMSSIERAQFAAPADGFGMVRVPLFLFRDHDPDRMQFAVLAQQMLATQVARRQIPDSQALNGRQDVRRLGTR